MIHDEYEDVSDLVKPSPETVEVLELLELNPQHRELVRLSRADQRRVKNVRDRLAEARRPAVPAQVPAPRTPSDSTTTAGVP